MSRSSLALLCTATALVCATQTRAQSLSPLPTFGTNGWLAPGDTPYLSTGNTERGMSFNPLTGNVVLVARQNVAGVSNNVRLFDGISGADNGGLDNTTFSGGTFVINCVDVADDGSIYACNLSTSAASPFKVYKWDSEATGLTTPPSVAYDAVSGVARTGDCFAVTGGSGSNPVQFAAAGSNNVSASNFVIGTTDGSNSSVAYLSVPGTTTTSNDYRLSLTFIDQNTVIGNQGATARLTTFDGVNATVAASIPLGGAARRGMDYAEIGGRPLLAVIDSNSALVTVFDLTDPNNPIELASANNTTGTLASNANGTGTVAWGNISGNSATLYAMNSNQGIQAFTFDLTPAGTATVFGTGCDGVGLSAVGLPALGNAGFQLSVDNVPAISPVAFVAFGTGAIDPGISLTPIGMAGCFGHTNLDLGLFGTGPVTAATGLFPLPIPNDPTLAGATLAGQGVTLSAATALLLASSNGVALTLGF